MSVFLHVKHVLISCVMCIIALHSCAWMSNLRSYQWPCSLVALSVRHCCLDKQTGTEMPDNRFGPAWGPLTVTLIATLQEQQEGHDHCVLSVFFVFTIINESITVLKWDFWSCLRLKSLRRFFAVSFLMVGGADEMTGHPLFHTSVI